MNQASPPHELPTTPFALFCKISPLFETEPYDQAFFAAKLNREIQHRKRGQWSVDTTVQHSENNGNTTTIFL